MVRRRARPLRDRDGARRDPGDDGNHRLAAVRAAGGGLGAIDTARECGSALGIAVLGGAPNERYRAGIDSALASGSRALPPESAEAARNFLPAADQACADGTGAALVTAAVVLVVAAVSVLMRARRRGEVVVPELG